MNRVPPVLVLASGSPTRAAQLRAAGIAHVVEASGVGEDRSAMLVPAEVLRLAGEKARAVAARRSEGLVLACDSLLELDGIGYGKPEGPDAALERWRRLRGRRGTLYTGHVLADVGRGLVVEEVVGTVVAFGWPEDEEIAAYVASGEPLDKAGAFTLEGRSSPFIEEIVGDASNVRGLSLAALRRLYARLGYALVRAWSPDRG